MARKGVHAMRTVMGMLLLFVGTWVPMASAEECMSRIEPLCDPLDGTEAERLFGDYADLVALAVALVVLVLLLSIIVWIFRRGREGPRIAAEPRDPTVEVAAGGSGQLLIDVENRRSRTGTDVIVDWGALPEGWTSESFAAVTHPSGFTTPAVLSADRPLRLSSQQKGSHQATIAVQLTAPEAGLGEEALDIPIRVVPLMGGVARPRRSVLLRFTVKLSTKTADLQITNVSHEPARVTAGQPVLTRATVANLGDGEARDVGVAFYLNDQSVAEKVVPALAANQETAVEFQWVPGPGENRIRVHIA